MTDNHSSSLRPGSVFAGKFVIETVLGEGAMGVVVAARHLALGKRVAIKCLLPSHRGDPAIVARFHRETRATSRLESEHVARVVDSGEIAGGPGEAPLLYLVMEHHDGRDLRSLLRAGGPFPVREAADYLAQACLGLAEAHALGIVHRDVKPANLFRTRRRDGSVLIKVIDFGIAKFQSHNASGDQLDVTECASMMGSLQYMAPEQVVDAKSVDARADVWSLGATLYHLVAGRPPFRGEDATDLAFNVLTGAARPLTEFLPAVEQGFGEVVMRCLQRRREDRFSSVVELARALAPHARAPSSAPGAQLLRATVPLSDEDVQSFRRAAAEMEHSVDESLEDADGPPTQRVAAA